MHRSFLSVSLALCGLSAVYFAGGALAETDAERAARLEAESKAFDRETRPVEKAGCKEYWDSDNRRSIERVIKACARALERTDWNDVQRGYAYHVRGMASAVADKLPEALSDLDQAITLNPNYAPSYYERAYVHQRQRTMNEAAADFRKSVELGNKGAEYPLSILNQTCPSLTWERDTCLASGASPTESAASVGNLATNTGLFSCGPNVAMPPTCTQMNTLFTQDIAKTWSCPSDVARPSGCEALFEQKVRYACDVQYFKNPPPECTLVSSGSKTNLIDCPANLHPGMLCKSPTTEDLAAHPSVPAATATPNPTAPVPAPPASPPPVVAAPEAEPSPPAQKSGWFSWLWGSETAEPPAPPPQSSVTATSPPATPPPSAAPVPAAPPSHAAASPSQLAPVPPGCPIGQSFGGWTVRRGSLQGVPVVTTGSSATHVGTATKWTSDDLSFEMIPRKDGKWLPMLFVKNLGHAGASVREITGPYAVLVWNAATKRILGGVESEAGGNNMYREPHTIIGVAPDVMEKLIDKIEATPNINIALALPKEDGSGLIDVIWIELFQSSGLRAAMAAAKPCALE